jgi:hypothetical protein
MTNVVFLSRDDMLDGAAEAARSQNAARSPLTAAMASRRRCGRR